MTVLTRRHIINTAAAWMPLHYLVRKSPFRLVMPFWHCVADETPPHIRNLYLARDTRSFRYDMEELVKYFKPVSASDVLQHVTGERSLKEPSMLLSFDDGLRESAEVIAPILSEMGIPAVFFVNTAFVDNRDMFYRFRISLLIDRLRQMKSKEVIYEIISGRIPANIGSDKQLCRYLLGLEYQDSLKINELAELFEIDFTTYLKMRKPYMTGEQISSMIEQGFDIGAHSIDHPLFARLTLEEQIRQTRESLDWLRGNFRTGTACFAFPFTDDGVSREFFEEIFSDHPGNPDLTFGTAGLKNDVWPRHLQRIHAGSSPMGTKGLIKSEYLLYYMKKIAGKHFVNR